MKEQTAKRIDWLRAIVGIVLLFGLGIKEFK